MKPNCHQYFTISMFVKSKYKRVRTYTRKHIYPEKKNMRVHLKWSNERNSSQTSIVKCMKILRFADTNCDHVVTQLTVTAHPNMTTRILQRFIGVHILLYVFSPRSSLYNTESRIMVCVYCQLCICMIFSGDHKKSLLKIFRINAILHRASVLFSIF